MYWKKLCVIFNVSLKTNSLPSKLLHLQFFSRTQWAVKELETGTVCYAHAPNCPLLCKMAAIANRVEKKERNN